MNREEFWAAIENSTAQVTFSRYCISGLVPDCGCQRCMRGRGEVPTFRTELRAARRSRKESTAFHERTRAWLKDRPNAPKEGERKMLTSKQIAQNDQLTEEYGDGRDPKVGRIDYSPDYKSEKRLPAPWDVDGFTDGATVIIDGKPQEVTELARLRDAVVEAAKKWRTERDRIVSYTYTFEEAARLRSEADAKLFSVVDTLLEFEAKQDQK